METAATPETAEKREKVLNRIMALNDKTKAPSCCLTVSLGAANTMEGKMAISTTDAEKMRRLAQEGKQISRIAVEDFPHLDYWEVYFEVYSGGERSSRGIKRMITTRLNAIATSTSKSERATIAEDLQGLVWHLYENHKTNQVKLSKIRAALGE